MPLNRRTCWSTQSGSWAAHQFYTLTTGGCCFPIFLLRAFRGCLRTYVQCYWVWGAMSTLCTGFQWGEICVVKDNEKLVSEGIVNRPELVIATPCWILLLEDSILLYVWYPGWYFGHLARVVRVDKQGICDLGILLFRWEHDTKVSDMPSLKGYVRCRCVHRQDLVDILDGQWIRFFERLGR